MRYQIIIRAGQRAEYWLNRADQHVQAGDFAAAARCAQFFEAESAIAFAVSRCLQASAA